MTLRIRLITLAVVIACLLMIALQVRLRRMRASYLVLWTSLCLFAMPLIIVPNAVDDISAWLGIYYPPATLFLAATMVLFLISIHFSREITRLEERTRILAEELALERAQRSATLSRDDAADSLSEQVQGRRLMDEATRDPVEHAV